MKNRIAGKTVLITGASSGIGQAYAEEFAKYGVNIILAARRLDRLERLKETLAQKYTDSKILVLGIDITNSNQVETELSSLPREFANIDILVNNAGLALGLNNFNDDDLQNWETMIETNIKGFFAVLRIVVKQMVSRKLGHIINIGSIAGIEAYAKGSVYCATKYAVHAVSRSLREELVEHGIKVSEIMPGATNTEFSLVRFDGDKERADSVYNGFDALNASDIADLIVYSANLPSNANLAESLILAASQYGATKIYRK